MADAAPSLDDLERRVRIQRALDESLKLFEESQKFMAEQHKLIEEAAKFRVERTLYPAVVIGTVIASTATLLAHWMR
jgi:hypothetical protein